MAQERDNLARDLVRETWQSWVAMPRWAQITLAAGVVVHLVAVLGPFDNLPASVIGTIRLAAFIAIVIGLVENAKTLDEFYARVYLDASAISVVASSIAIYAAWNFHLDLGARTVAVIGVTFIAGFVIAFARLRRA